MMKNDVYRLFVFRFILKLSHFLYFELDVTSLTGNSGNNNKSESWSSFIKFSEAWHTYWVQPNEQFGLFIRLSWQYTRLQFLFFHFLNDPISNEINSNFRYFRLILLYSTYRRCDQFKPL
jgi:hypothetical protein